QRLHIARRRQRDLALCARLVVKILGGCRLARKRQTEAHEQDEHAGSAVCVHYNSTPLRFDGETYRRARPTGFGRRSRCVRSRLWHVASEVRRRLLLPMGETIATTLSQSRLGPLGLRSGGKYTSNILCARGSGQGRIECPPALQVESTLTSTLS